MKYPKCPICGVKMTIFDGVSWYSCPNNCTDVRDNGDGTYTESREIFSYKEPKRDIEDEEWPAFEDGWRPDDY